MDKLISYWSHGKSSSVTLTICGPTSVCLRYDDLYKMPKMTGSHNRQCIRPNQFELWPLRLLMPSLIKIVPHLEESGQELQKHCCIITLY